MYTIPPRPAPGSSVNAKISMQMYTPNPRVAASSSTYPMHNA